jgi:hypothetical protein
MEKYGFSTTGSQDGYVPTGSWNESQGQSSKNEIPQLISNGHHTPYILERIMQQTVGTNCKTFHCFSL